MNRYFAPELVDEALAVVLRAPKSYTAEDSAEIQVHGGAVSARVVLELCLSFGARLAEPGEFTRRAFLNGRIDLAQAEAVLDMVSAQTDLMLRAATHQLSGDLSQKLNAVREKLVTIYAGFEALMNFPDDDTDFGQSARLGEDIHGVLADMAGLLDTAHSGVVLREGIRMVIGGKPNSGKSSLLNALLKHPRAIVTDIAGTTRDTLEERANLKGIPVNLVDTAGILAPRDRIEEEAVRRSRDSMASADIVLLVLDRSLPIDEVDRALLSGADSKRMVIILNKRDLPAAFGVSDVLARVSGCAVVEVSALTREGLPVLEDALVRIALKGRMPEADAVLLTNVRHVRAMRSAVSCLGQSLEAMDDGAPLEIIADGVKNAVNSLDAITGRNVDEDTIERIFAGFCIGK